MYLQGRLPLLLSAACLATTCPIQPADCYTTNASKASSWQRRLDKALLDIDAKPQARVRSLERALRDPDLPVDVSLAIRAIRKDGFGKGHPEMINVLWPRGTTARADLEGLFALTKQVPEAFAELRERTPELRLQELLSGAGGRLSGAAPPRAPLPKPEEITEELKNALRSTPKGLEAPKYALVRTVDGEVKLGVPERIEIRRYDAFKVASTPSMGGVGFNTLASYLFGANEEKEVMAMTMPVLIDRDGSDRDDGEMKFVLPSSVAAVPPTPLAGDDVQIEQVPERLVAIKPFPGLATDEEISRQKDALLSALRGAGIAVANEDEVSVLQYNSPLTLPWRRRNEIALVVAEEGKAASELEEEGARERWQARTCATSWYDAGVRL